jgi:hypothetical protein
MGDGERTIDVQAARALLGADRRTARQEKRS